MKNRKCILVMMLLCMIVFNLFTIPVMAAELTSAETRAVGVADIPSDAIYAGTLYRDGGPFTLGRITLSSNTSKLYIYLPRDNNMDLWQGTIQFRNGLNIVTKQVSNAARDTWVFTASDLGRTGIWNVILRGNAIGTSQKCELFYKVEN